MIALKEIHKALLSYETAFQREQEFRSLLLKRIEKNKNLLDREEPGGHFVVSAFLLNTTSQKVALLHHRKLDRWLQIGGHLEKEDLSIEGAALREIQEETGLLRNQVTRQGDLFDLDIHNIPARPGQPLHDHYDLRYLFIVHSQAKLKLNTEEANHLDWFSIEEAAKRMDSESSRRVFQKIKAFVNIT